jgi:methyl-accepting chemotaxis protein WspA
MKKLIDWFNGLSINRRLIIMFSAPQLLLGLSLIYIIKDKQHFDNSALLILLAMAIIVSLYYFLRFSITTPLLNAVEAGLQSIDDVMNEFTVKKDSRPIKNSKSKSEIIQIINNFFALASALDDIVEREKEINTDLEGKAEFILDIVSRAAQGDLTGEMMIFSANDSVSQVAAGVSTMLENLSNLVKQVQLSGIQVTSSATQIAATAKEQEATVAEQAENTAESASKGHAALVSMETTMAGMQMATESISSKLSVLSEKADNINTVVVTINRVADQTNLLSLNAAIEAEKAGEYGRGFSVVATEIRRLADQTAVATWDIEQMVKEMLSAVSAGVMSMDKFSDEVNQGVSNVAKVGSQLAHIIEQVQILLPRFDTVNESTRLQSEGAEQIKESMIQLNEMAQQTAESLRQSNQSIEQLKDAAHGLQEGVSIFKVSE